MLPAFFVDNLFDDFFDDAFGRRVYRAGREAERALYGKHAADLMKTDVRDAGSVYEVCVDLPGFKKGEVKAELKDGYLTITAAKGLDKDEETKQGYVRRERFAGTCSRSFYVGNIRQEEIKGKYEDGVLTLYVPKESKPIEEGPKLIAIE